MTTADDGRRIYDYDSLNMLMRVQPGPGLGTRRMVYDADDERIGTIISTTSRWTIRDFGGRVIREFKGYTSPVWVWEQDHFYGGGALVGGETQEWPSTYPPTEPYIYGGPRHYHLDHLGSVRMVTESGGQRAKSISEHEGYPFGTTMPRTYQQQLNWGDPHIDSMRFAGHQRDFLGILNVDNTD